MPASSHQDHIHRLVSSLQALDVPDVELDHAQQIPGGTPSLASCLFHLIRSRYVHESELK